MSYILIDKKAKKGYVLSDLVQVSGLIKRSYHTVKNWFRNGKTYYGCGSYEICKGYTEMKSPNRNVGNLVPFNGRR